ncbi:MAG: hypothetical protein P8M78_17745 [Myxococcota bacterium]|nr:hypothetical protein [Myxococcota bacterium]
MTPTRQKSQRVRVQQSPHGLELIVDETFASFQASHGPATRCVWDAIAAPALALKPSRSPRVLVLGYGGGSAARIVRALCPQAQLTGVEFDPDVVDAARRHFDVEGLGVDLHLADARFFLEQAARQCKKQPRSRYDLILEDVFVGRGDAVHKPDWIPEPGHVLARRCLRRGGILVSNTLDEAAPVQAALRSAFSSVLSITVEDYDNRILVASDAPLSARRLRRQLAAEPLLRESLEVLSLRTIQTKPWPVREG